MYGKFGQTDDLIIFQFAHFIDMGNGKLDKETPGGKHRDVSLWRLFSGSITSSKPFDMWPS